MLPIEVAAVLVLAIVGSVLALFLVGAYLERRFMTEARKKEIEAEKREKERRARSPMRVAWWVIYIVIVLGFPALFIVDGLVFRVGLLYSPYLSFFNPFDTYVQVAGVVLSAMGLVILLASGTVLIEHVFSKASEERRLITTGIYAYVRHPIYLSNVLIGLGLVLITLNYLAVVIPLTWFSDLVESEGKTRPVLQTTIIEREERELLERFGREYEEYMKRTGRLLPRIRR
ncbi:MAG: methyltransferase family protein [Candidatus Geothermarchaeales archaeon]